MKAKRLFTFALLAGTLSVHLCAQLATDTLREVVITGTGTTHLLKDAPVQTEVISRKMLDAFGGKSIEEILGGLTASFSFNEGDMGSQMQLGGLGNAYILILIDGKRLHGDVGGENDLGLIDPQNIERIEIVRGAQSALYGSDAMAGVINIITRKHHQESIYLENTTRHGSHQDWRQHNGVGLAFGKVSSYTNWQVQHSDGWQNTSQEFAEAQVISNSVKKTVNRFTNWQLSERLTYTPTPQWEYYADGSIYRKDIVRPKDGKHPSCDVFTYDLMYRNASLGAGAKWKINRTDVVTLDLDWNLHNYYYHFTATTLMDGYDPNGVYTNYFPYFAGQSQLQSRQERYMAHLKGIFVLPHQHHFSTGLEYRYDYLHAPMRTATGTAGDQTTALYVQDEWNLIPWLNITAGLRLNQNRGFGFRATPKISTLLSAGDFRFRMGWSQGFKTPTTKELYYRYLHVMGSSTFFNLGNTNLHPQTSNYYHLGTEYRGRHCNISVTGYLNRVDRMIALVNVPVSEIPKDITSSYTGDGSNSIVARQYLNMEDARTYGVDINVQHDLSRQWTAGGNYSYLNTDANRYDPKHDRLQRVTIDGMAHHKWNAFVTWTHRCTDRYRFSVQLSTRGSSKRYYQNNGDGKAFQIWRVNSTHDWGKADSRLSYRLTLGIDNILNYRDMTMHPLHLGTTTAGRTAYVGFGMKFRQGKKTFADTGTKGGEHGDEEE